MIFADLAGRKDACLGGVTYFQPWALASVWF
jgi:hypothetical protein